PTKASGAISAPVLMPVTILKDGRVRLSDHPTSTPAPNAPLSPPPDIASRDSGGIGRPSEEKYLLSRSYKRPPKAVRAPVSLAMNRASEIPATPARSVSATATAGRRSSCAHAPTARRMRPATKRAHLRSPGSVETLGKRACAAVRDLVEA